MFHIFLGCFSWAFFYITLKSHFRNETHLDSWDFFVDEGRGHVSYTNKREMTRLSDSESDFEEQEDDDEKSDEEEKMEEEVSDESEKIDDYVLTSDTEEEVEVKDIILNDVAESESNEATSVEGEQEEQSDEAESTTLIDTWESVPHKGMDHFREEIYADLTDEEQEQVDSAMNYVLNIMEKLDRYTKDNRHG